jgi:germination protein M
VAERKKTPTGRRNGSSLGCLFWIAFLLVIIGLFLFNRELIRHTLENTKFFDRILSRPSAEAPVTPSGDALPSDATSTKPIVEAPIANPASPITIAPAAPAAETKPAEDEPIVVPAPVEKPAQKPVDAPTVKVAPAASAVKPVETKPKAVETPAKKDRTLWFVHLDDDGVIARMKSVRSFPASDSPLADALTALLAGPSTTEKQKGLSSLIPNGTKLLSAMVRGNTAYLSFSEEFQFNAYGIEGYAAQLRQIVWTVTEFPNVETVQILIEGRRVDYLGSEGIWIGGPIGRDSL